MLRTMIVGSLPRPSWLAQPSQVYTSYRLEGDALREAQDDAVRLALRDQEVAGLDIVTDGEQRRRHYIWGFCEGLTGLDFARLVKIQTRGNRYGALVDAARVVGPVASAAIGARRSAAVPEGPHDEAREGHAAGADDHDRHPRRRALR